MPSIGHGVACQDARPSWAEIDAADVELRDDAAGNAQPPAQAANEEVADPNDPGAASSSVQGAEATEGQAVQVDKMFPSPLWIPGVMHILHSIAGEVPKCLDHYEGWFIPKLRQVIDFFTKPWLVERFREMCLEGVPEAAQFRKLFEGSVNASLAEWRWLSLVQSLVTCLERELPLRLFWNPRRIKRDENFQWKHVRNPCPVLPKSKWG